jgi:uncharacterized protein YqhQ
MSKFRTSIGGQAVMEGIAMRGPDMTCLSVRRPDGTIQQEVSPSKKNPFDRYPILRGIASMVIALESGYTFLLHSSDIAFPDQEEDKLDKWLNEHFGENNKVINYGVALLAGLMSIGLFMFLPTFITGIIAKVIPGLDVYKTFIESILKIAIFIIYIYSASRMDEIARVFKYHGAEHKTIFCYENGEELTVENVRKQGRFHPRCGTSFTFITLLISILLFSFIPWNSTLSRIFYKLLCLPLIMGISYEFIRYAGRHDNTLSRLLSFPGLLVQRLTVFEPEDDMIEVAINAMKAVIPEDPEKDKI